MLTQRAHRSSLGPSAPRPPIARLFTKKTDDGLPVHSFRSLSGDLATITHNTMAMAPSIERPPNSRSVVETSTGSFVAPRGCADLSPELCVFSATGLMFLDAEPIFGLQTNTQPRIIWQHRDSAAVVCTARRNRFSVPTSGGHFASSTHGRHWSPSFNFPTQQKVASSSAWGRSKRVSAMTHKGITLEIVLPTVLAIALCIVLSIGAVYLTDQYLGPVDQVEANRSVAGSREIAECQILNFRAFACC
jgi:hypothetical protein